jgi:5-dehydro-4-deoxyglucarate dehydratase
VELYRLASTADFDGLRSYHQRVVRPFYELRQRGRGFEVSVMKAAMALLGHPAGPARPPLGTLSDRDRTDLRALLDRLEVPSAASRTRVPLGSR